MLSSVFYKSAHLISILGCYIVFSYQFINLEMLYKYCRLLSHYNRWILSKRHIRPDFDTRATINYTLAKFPIDNMSFRISIHQLNKLMSVSILCVNIALYSNIVMTLTIISLTSVISMILFIIALDIYFIITQVYFYVKHSVQTSVINNLIEWRELGLVSIRVVPRHRQTSARSKIQAKLIIKINQF